MEQITIPYGYIYKFDAEESLTERMLNQVKQLNFTQRSTNSQSDHDLYFDKELYDWFDLCIREVSNKLNLPKNIRFPITSCWANKTGKLQTHHEHAHPNSFMSGIFYLTNCSSGGKTTFTSPNLWEKNFSWLSFENPVFSNSEIAISPSKGSLLLFPSALKHGVQVVKDTESRFSIAFNVFLSGDIGNKIDKTYLSINVKSVKERLDNL